MIKCLMIYKNNRTKTPMAGWKIFDTNEEADAVLNFYKEEYGNKQFDITVGDSVVTRYKNYEELQGDVELVSITTSRATVLEAVFEGKSFGTCPL